MAEMTKAEMVRAFEEQLAQAQTTALKVMSPVQVATLEACGLRLAPTWMVDMMRKLIAKETK